MAGKGSKSMRKCFIGAKGPDIYTRVKRRYMCQGKRDIWGSEQTDIYVSGQEEHLHVTF